jgi:hypothetical protein
MTEENRCEGTKRRRAGRKIIHVLGFTLLGIVIAVFFAFVFGFVAKWLWNWLMPDIFGLRQITYWQAFGLILLTRLLFGGFRHHGHDHHMQHHGHRFRKGLPHDHEDLFRHHADLLNHHWKRREGTDAPAGEPERPPRTNERSRA